MTLTDRLTATHAVDVFLFSVAVYFLLRFVVRQASGRGLLVLLAGIAVWIAGQLMSLLESHREYRSTSERVHAVRSLLRDDLLLKFAAIGIAVCVWIGTCAEATEVHRTFVLPIEYKNVPASVRLSETLTREVKVTFAGPEKAFSFIAPSVLKVSINVSELANGKSDFTITDAQIRHPGSLRVSAVEPRSVSVATSR